MGVESKKRSILKALSWRIGGTLVTFALAWYASRDVVIGAKVGAGEFSFKFLAFYFHERIWTHIKVG